MFNNETRNQHFISQVEQKLNCIDPTLPRERRRIYKFKIDDREELTFNLVNPLGVKIENNLSFNDLYTFDVFSDRTRNNFEAYFRKYEVNIEVFTNKILNKIDKNEAITIEEIKDLIFCKMMNFIRNPFSIEKCLNIFGSLSTVSPTDTHALREFRKIKKENIHVSPDVLAQLNITEDKYIQWLKMIFNFFSVKMPTGYLGEEIIDAILDIDKKRIYVGIHTYDQEICLLSDRSFVDYGPALPNNFFCFAFNLNKNTFLSFMIFENTLENIKLFCPEIAPVIDDRNLTIDVMSLLPPRIELLVSKNNIEALRGYNTQVVYQCHNHFFSASTSFLLNN